MDRLNTDWLAQVLAGCADLVAPQLLGLHLVVDGSTADTPRGERVIVRIVETEAYGGVGEDPASHAHRGRTPRNSPMFAAAGTLYVYFTYGMHWCANVVCGPFGRAAAVLVRAGEIVEGGSKPVGVMASGPARLARIMGIDGRFNGASLVDSASSVRLVVPADYRSPTPGSIGSGPRVGVRAAADRPWRFWLADSAAVSAYRPHRRAVGGTANRT